MRRALQELSGDFFEIPAPAPAAEGAQDYRAEISLIVSGMLAEAGKDNKDRYAIAAEMSRLSGHEVSKAMLDGYSAESRETFNVPLAWALVLEAACSSYALTQWLVSKRGGKFLIGREAIDAEIGRQERIADAASRRVRELKQQARGGK